MQACYLYYCSFNMTDPVLHRGRSCSYCSLFLNDIFWMFFLQIVPWLPYWIPSVFVDIFSALDRSVSPGLKDTIIGIYSRRDFYLLCFSMYRVIITFLHPRLWNLTSDIAWRLDPGVFEILKAFWMKIKNCLYIYLSIISK